MSGFLNTAHKAMRSSWVTLGSRRFFRWTLGRAADHAPDLKRSALVFSPHFDDETLGCGGTLFKKRRAGAEVRIVFMTDGSKSHRHLISEKQLSSIRRAESLAAVRLLGIPEDRVCFLDFEETNLSEHADRATAKVQEILAGAQPEEIYIPYYYATAPHDHVATNRIVRSALTRCRATAIVYEYPIWFWSRWPWALEPLGSRWEILTVVKDGLIGSWRLMADFRCSIYIGDVLELKRAALDQYKSQVTRLVPSPRWLTLADVAAGDFLECFFQEREVFHRYELRGGP